MAPFVPARLTLARHRRGLTKGALAARAGLSSKSISMYEGGATDPEPETISLLAKHLDFPVEFFLRPDPPVIDERKASFRSLRSMTAAQRNMVLAAGSIAIELDQWIDKQFKRPAPTIPDLRSTTPEGAAEALRAEWGLGYKRIQNIVHLLELHGARVYSLVHDSREVDAFSLWWGDQPFIFLNTMKSAEHSRFDAAHELAHLVLHHHGGVSGREAESEADKFASAFLMPKRDVIARGPRWPSPKSVIQAKHYWGVSAMALVYRLHTVGMLTDHYYNQLCIRLRMQYGSSEPEEMPRESSQALAKVLTALRRDGTSRREVARGIGVYPREIRDLLFGLVLQPVAGGSPKAPPSQTPKLSLM